ncbi:hypothetical protein ACLOJK_025625 [Asimina triloba]
MEKTAVSAEEHQFMILISKDLYSVMDCVSAFVDFEWKKGVVLDHEETSVKRLVFFPDESSELMIPVHHLHVSKFWDEVSGTWRPCGFWFFLCSVKKLEQQGDSQLWDKLVFEAAWDNIFVAGAQDLWCTDSLHTECLPIKFFNGSPAKEGMPTRAIVSQQNQGIPAHSSYSGHGGLLKGSDSERKVASQRYSLHPCMVVIRHIHEKDAWRVQKPQPASKACKNVKPCEMMLSQESQKPLWKEVIYPAEYSLETISEYCIHSGDMKNIVDMKLEKGSALKAKMHLSFIGWKIESKQDRRSMRIRYVSPEGKSYYSLRSSCMSLMDHQRRQNNSNSKLTAPSSKNACCTTSIIQDNYSIPCQRKLITGNMKSTVHGASKIADVVIERGYFPEAVRKYVEYGSKSRKHGWTDLSEGIKQVRSKAKMHLAYEGWQFWIFASLQTACKEWIERDDAMSNASASLGEPSEVKNT